MAQSGQARIWATGAVLAAQRTTAKVQSPEEPQLFLLFGNIASVSREHIDWDSPSSFLLYANGDWELSVARLSNGFDDYGPSERHFQVRWTWMVNYQDDQGIVVYNTGYVAGVEGYLESTANVVVKGNDAQFLAWREKIRSASGYVQLESFH